MRTKWLKTPALPSALGVASGIYAGYTFEPSLIFIPSAVIVATAVYVFLHRPDIALGFAACALGLALGTAQISRPLPAHMIDTEGIATGRIERIDITPYTTRAVIRVHTWQADDGGEPEDVDFNILCTIRPLIEDICEGEEIVVKGKITPPEARLLVPYQTDYNRFLFLDKIAGRINVYNPENIELYPESVTAFQRFINGARTTWINAVSHAGFNSATTAFMLTVIAGDDTLLSPDLEQQFRQSGLAHILAISGMHVAIVMLVLTALFYPIKLLKGCRPVYYVILSLLIVFYALVTGGSPSACRAAAMCCVIMGCRIFETRPNALQSLLVAVITLLCIKPLWLFAPGFQLSVCAVLSLIVILPRLQLPQRYNRVIRNTWLVVITPVVAMAGTLVPTLFYFHSFSVGFWLANIAAAVFVPLLIVLGFITSFFALFGLFSSLLCHIADILYSAATGTINFTTSLLPENEIAFFPTTGLLVFILSLVIAATVLLRRFNRRNAFAATLILLPGILIFSTEKSEALPVAEYYITRSGKATCMVFVHDGRSYLWTSENNQVKRQSIHADVCRSYRDFFLHRGSSTEPEIILHNLISTPGKTIFFADNSGDTVPSGTGYVVVTENFRGDISRLLAEEHPDSVFIAPSVHPALRKRFSNALEELGLPYRSLRERGFSLTIR